MTNSINSTAGGAAGAGLGPLAAAVRSALAAAKAASSSASETTSASTGADGQAVSISKEALAAARSAADAKRTPDELAADVRSELDRQVKAGGRPDFREMSGRATAIVALNADGKFSKGEVFAAKEELNGRTRQEFTAAMTGISTAGGIAQYSAAMLSEYDSMSSEERQARGWTPEFAQASQSFLQARSQMPSIWDQIGHE